MEDLLPEVYLARHGETEWSISGRHTGRTDIPLTENGEENARGLGGRLGGKGFDRVWTSPLQRARRTCELAGFGDRAGLVDDLREWDYGEYEGLRSVEIRQSRPGWDLFRDGCPGGESVGEVGARADRVVAGLREVGGTTLVFSHGHFLRVLAARWLGMPPEHGRYLVLGTAALSVLGYEHNPAERVIRLWNDVQHVGR